MIDTRTANEGDGWAGSGANPWYLDNQTESILFLTDESDKPARIGFHVVAGGVIYRLTQLKLNPHETRAIDIRKLRSAQNKDFLKNQIPAGASDGSVEWNRIDNVAVTGRLVVIQKNQGVASSYDCCICNCPESYEGLSTSPIGANILPGGNVQFYSQGEYENCNKPPADYFDETGVSIWASSNTSVANMDPSHTGQADGIAGGTSNITAKYSDYRYSGSTCSGTMTQHEGESVVTVGAYPTNFHQVDGYAAAGGVLHFDYAWGSSTGNLSDLSSCMVTEIVTYPGTADPYDWPSPPWDTATPNPTIPPGVNGTLGGSQDDHTPETFLKPYTAATFTATQTYQYSCYQGALNGPLMGPLSIVRTVSKNTNGSFAYKITKSGVAASINPLP